MTDTRKLISNTSGRQKVMAVIFIVVVAFVLWQVIGLFGGGSKSTAKNKTNNAMALEGPEAPRPAQLPKPAAKEMAMSTTEAELLKLQEETQKKYLAAINELQVLKLSQEIAETNQAIMSAKLATITAEKSIVDLLAPEASPPPLPSSAYGPGLGAEGAVANAAPTNPPPEPTPPPTPMVSPDYVVVSVTQLHSKWGAVIGNQGKLYSVSIGDVLPLDGSEVVSIDKSGVTLEKEGQKTKFSMLSASN